MDVNRCHSHDGIILHFGVYKSRRGDDEKFVERKEHGQNSPPSIPSALIASCSSGASYEVPLFDVNPPVVEIRVTRQTSSRSTPGRSHSDQLRPVDNHQFNATSSFESAIAISTLVRVGVPIPFPPPHPLIGNATRTR